ncbi:MAG TPA: sigma-54 dependent transcriptional regulator [Steroidobacteraceae bacterium]|jgi:DNA-binding NtrC family response regulator|nr:sigma-54 dependent transcriptional regulator [Steroidobacteraceae bacterium]
MTQTIGPVLIHPNAQSNVLSVRAKALIFSDPRSQALLERIEQVARSEAPVLITGETGTGKELVARHVHRESGRKGEFVAVNCGALSPSLAEAELFGHQAGAFTGATETRAGWFEVANGGTLFLDEVGDLPLGLQVKLLRVLQEREVVRVGSRKPLPLDIRLLAATNIDLPEAVAAGRFRMDLYYRLNVVTLDVPTLAARPGDILPLAEHFLRMYSTRLQARTPLLTLETQHALLRYGWPGNIRELENVIHSALLTARDGAIRPENLRLATPAKLAESDPDRNPLDVIEAQLERLFADPPPGLYSTLEELIVRAGYRHSSNNQLQTARLFGISRNIVRTQLKRFGLIA